MTAFLLLVTWLALWSTARPLSGAVQFERPKICSLKPLRPASHATLLARPPRQQSNLISYREGHFLRTCLRIVSRSLPQNICAPTKNVGTPSRAEGYRQGRVASRRTLSPRRLHRDDMSRPAERVVAFYNKRGTCEQWIKEGKGAIKWTRLSCRTFAANAVRLQLHALAYNFGNFLRRRSRSRTGR